MGIFGGGKSPSPPGLPAVPPAAHPAVLGSTSVALAGAAAKQRAAAAEGAGFDDTIKTTPEGLKTPVSTAPATLLGQ